MKIRQGFVSNSSSSSFIVMVKQEAFNAIQNGTITGLTDLQLKALKQQEIWYWKPATVFGTPCMVIQTMNSNESGDLEHLGLTDEELDALECDGIYSCCDIINSIKHPDIFTSDSGY